jgi:two-component system chemotaxis sensor kinase CheA
MVTELRYEPVELPLHRAAAQASALARRLNKGDIEIAVEACDVRLDPRRWKPFWSAFVHAIRNAVDHGIEDATERAASGKRSVGRLRLSAELCGAELVIALEDDGRGIDWDRVCARARSERLPHQTPAELKDALFSEGLSTRDQATEVSGRGIGLNAVRQAVMALEGRIELTSRRGEGTTLRLRFPAAARLSLPPLAKPSPAAA